MVSRFLGKKAFQNVLFFLYLVFAIGLPLTKIALSLSTLLIAFLIIVEGDFKNYYQKIKFNKVGIWLGLFFIFHLLSLSWSSDLNYALLDLKSKLTLYVICFALILFPMKNLQQVNLLLGSFLLAVFVTSLINFGFYFNWWGSRNYTDAREMSIFISHIRFSLMVTMSAGIVLCWLIFNSSLVQSLRKNYVFKIFLSVIFVWFVFYTYYAQVLSGMLTFVAMILLILVYFTIKSKNKFVKFISLFLTSATIITVVFILSFLFKSEKNETSLTDLKTHTAEGNVYLHRINDSSKENGNFTYIYLCEKELKREWELRSSIPYDSLDFKRQEIKYTLIRYMTSKGLKKDAQGLQELTKTDIQNVEAGITSVSYLNGGFKQRLKEIKVELQSNHDPNSSAILQRIEFWKTGLTIFKRNLLIGVGPGDIENEFQKQYEADNSLLRKENRWQSHNQFLNYLISYGLLGCIFFFGMLYAFFKLNFRSSNMLGLIFFTIVMLSFLVEDTLETQMGIAFFSLFFGFFSNNHAKNQY
jgi:hypothetical protein